MTSGGIEGPGNARARTLVDATFPGGSEMARLCRAFDWGSTPLGPVEDWSHALRTTVGIVLTSRNPMFLCWGPHLVQFYNDSYRPSFGEGGRHGSALGAEARLFWTDIWSTIAPEFETVMATGESTWHEDTFFPIERNGTLEDTWWTYGYNPVYDDDGSIGGVLAVCMETTQRVLHERERSQLLASLESERRTLDSVFQLSPSFLAVLRGPDHVFERANAAYFAVIGNREVIGKSLVAAIPELDPKFFEILRAVRTTGEPFVAQQLPVQLARREAGAMETRYVDVVYSRILDAAGEPLIVAHGVDVTEHVLAEQALKRVETQLRDQFAKLPVPTMLWEESETDFVLLDFNDAARRTVPGLDDHAIGKTGAKLFPDQSTLIDKFRQCLRENLVSGCTTIVAGADAMRTLEITIGPQRPNRVLVHAVDITQRLELEEQLRQAQKMEAVGQLAGGVAHDFNNLLTVIQGHSSLLMDALGVGDERYSDAEEINKAGLRAGGLTRQLLAFSNKQILKPVRLGLNEIAREAEKMLSRLLGENIGIDLKLLAHPDGVTGDASQFSQILLNLALNARDAMDGHGTLTISTYNSPHAGPAGSGPTGGYVVLEVSDTGSGMTEQTQARIFEPFFTTKPAGMGTGLGLPTVYGIVRKASGTILIDSRVGRGTTFRIYLPSTPVDAPTDSDTVRVEPDQGRETILLVEDESAVRQVVKRILETNGYAVLTAEDGLTALSVARSYLSDIDLVISDTVMPGIGGAETVARLQEARPKLKALFMSGHTDDLMLRSGVRASTVKFIQKPFTADDFCEAVRDALL